MVLGDGFVVDDLADGVPEGGFEALFLINMVKSIQRWKGHLTSSFSGSRSVMFHSFCIL